MLHSGNAAPEPVTGPALKSGGSAQIFRRRLAFARK